VEEKINSDTSEVDRNHSVISHAKAYKANAVTVMNTTIEPNRTITSFINERAVILGILVAL
jgi:hypothetical protein